MTDKSFGDFYNKNTIKNPLLSSAVTGLSLDELTHKAVLLPVSSIQELNARSDQQRTQNATLSHTHHDQPNPAGDAFPNIQISTQSIPSTNKNPINIQKSVKTDNTQKLSTAKASVKSEDDFDVNEYIARLQGSRYVSAPLHSHLKEDNNANLTTTEENLEEINLNETQNVEVHQQSLTADLAQNFSQLPTVLPHVASAVFSSFSNMLNLRSRDQTPDDRIQEVKPGYEDQGSYMEKPGVCQGSGLQRNSAVPLMVEDRPPKDLAPPPREPPVMTGPSNFRLPPKKKYAQIPGLSTGEAQILPYSSQAQAVPSFFTPGQVTTGASDIANQKPEIQAPSMPSFFIPGQLSVGVSETDNKKSDIQVSAMPTLFTPSTVNVGANETANSKDVNKQEVQTSSAPVFFSPPSMPVGSSETANVNVQSSTNINMFSATNEPYRSEMQANIPHFFSPASVAIGQSETAISHAQNITREAHKAEDQRTTVPNFFTPALVTADASEMTNINATNINMFSSNDQVVQSTSISAFFAPESVSIGRSEIANAKSVTNSNVFAPNEQLKTDVQVATMPVFFTPSSQTVGRNEMALKSNVTNVNIFNPNEPFKATVEAVAPAPFVDAQAPIIPPPPMFSNLRRDNQSTPAVGIMILPPSVARRISANQPLIRSQNVPMPCPDNIFVPEPGPTNDQANLRQPTVFQIQESLPKIDISRSIQDKTLPSSIVPPNMPSAPPTGPSLFNSSSIVSTDQIIPPPIEGCQTQPPIAFTPQSTSQQLAPSQPSSQPPKTAYVGIQSSTSGPQIFNPYSQTSESQSNGVPMFFTPSEILSASAQLSAPTMPSPDPSIFTPTTPASSQSSSLFTPEIQPNLAQPSTVPSSLYSPQNEPPKILIEPPKAIGPVSFRMTKKRPQYYSGPIEGVGSISNQVKPTIPNAVSNTDFPTSLFTPDSVKFETSSQPQGLSITPNYDKIQETYNTVFNEAQLQQGHFDLSQPQQRQEYNTAFDLSRPVTEAYDQPKPEPKGFGIIGSLKTKLSSIDINKIQSTVTTFFDPAYNDTKKVETSAQDIVPSQLGHKLDIYSFDYSNHYEKNCNDYQQRINQYQQESNGVRIALSDNSAVSHGYATTNIPLGFSNIPPGFSNINAHYASTEHFFLPKYDKEVENEFKTQNTNIKTEISTSVDHNTNANILLPQPDVITTLDQHFREDSGYIIDDILAQVTQNPTHYNPTATNLLNTSQQDASDTSFHGDNSSQFGHVGSSVPQKSSGLFSYLSCSELEARDVNPDLIEDTLRQFPNTAQSESLILNPGNAAVFFDRPDDNLNIDDVPTLATLAQTLDDDETEPTQDTPSNNFSQRIDVFNIQAGTLADNLANLTVSEAIREPAEIRPINNANRRQSADAIAAASTAPLFGLSAIIADRNREVDDVRPFNNARRHSILGSNSSASFFENMPTNDGVLEKTDLKGLSITDVRNVLLIEPPQEHICQVLKRNASSNLESTTPEVSRDNYLLDPPSSSFFDHTLRDVEHEDSDLNICETCREVNTPEPKNIDVTGRLIDNITSRIQLSNTVEFPYIDNMAPNVSIRETAIDDQLEEIRNITEDTIETLQAQSAIELLDDTPNPEYEAYSTAIQSCKYAFEDPEPVVKSSLNFKLDPDTEASLDYSAYYDSTTLFYHNRVPENASDEIKANYQASSQEDSEVSDDKSEPGLDVHLIEQDANQDFPIDEEYIIEPSETDDDKIETSGRLRTPPETSDTFTNRVERFQKAIDAGECFTYNSPTSLASYFDTGNYAVEAHFRNLQISPDLSSLRFPPGFEDEYDRRMSGYNGSPLAPPIPDCGSQTRSMNTATFSNPQQRHRKFSNDLQRFPTLLKAETDKPASVTRDTTEEDFRGPETIELFEPTAPELSVIEAKTPDLSTNGGDGKKTETLEVSEIQPVENEQLHLEIQEDNTSQEAEKAAEVSTNAIERKTFDIAVAEKLRSPENITEHYSTLLQQTTGTLIQEPNTTNLFTLETSAPNLLQEVTPTPILFKPQAANEMRTEFDKESDHKSQLRTNIEIKQPSTDFLKEPNTTKRKQEEPEIAKVLQSEEPRPTTEELTLQSTKVFDAKPVASIEEPISNINFFDNTETRNDEKQIKNTNLFEAKTPQSINIPSQALPDPLNFFSSKDESLKPESSDFNRLASYFSTPASKPVHSKSFFELCQSQNHYRNSSANSAQSSVRIEPNLDHNSRQNLTNLIKDLTSTQNIPTQENIVKTVNYFTVEYELKNDVKELVNKETTKTSTSVPPGFEDQCDGRLSGDIGPLPLHTPDCGSETRSINTVTFTHKVKMFQRAIDARECFTHNSPTSLTSYFDTGNYAVEAHLRNSQTSPDLSSLRFSRGFEDHDRSLSGDNGRPLPLQIPDCGSQSSGINTVTYTKTVEKFQKAADTGECFTYNSPTSLTSYLDTRNYAVEAHLGNSQTPPDLSSSRFSRGFEDHDRSLSGDNGRPLSLQIPDCGTQTSSINTVTFTKTVEKFQKADDAGERFTYNSPTSLTSYLDTGNYAVEAHLGNSQTPPDLSSLRFSRGFKDDDRSLSGDNGRPLPLQIPDCGSQTSSINTVTLSNLQQRHRIFSNDLQRFPTLLETETDKPALQTRETTEEVFRVPETTQLFQPTVPENAVIEAKTPDLSTNDGENHKTDRLEIAKLQPVENGQVKLPKLQEDITSQEAEKAAEVLTNVIEQKTFAVGVAEKSRPVENKTEYYSTLSLLTTDTLKQEPNIDIKQPPADFFKSNTAKREQEEPGIAEDLQTEESRHTTEQLTLQSTEVFDANPTASTEKQIKNTNLFEAKSPQSINISFQTLPEPLNFLSSKHESPNPESSDFNHLATYISTPALKPDHSKSLFELIQTHNHYRHSSANSAQNSVRIEPNLDHNSRQNSTNLIKDLTSTQNIPTQENIVKTINYFTVEYELKCDVKELVHKNTGKTIKIANKGDNSNIDQNNIKEQGENQTNNIAENLDEKTEIDNQNLTEQTDHDPKIKVLKDCHLCKSISAEHFKVRTCTNDTEPPKENSPSDMDRRVTTEPNSPVTDNILKNEAAEDGVTVVVETQSSEYIPVRHHWFYRFDVEDKSVWRGFSDLDSNALEEAFNKPDLNENTVVPTDGGRFDVNIVGRLRLAVYWKEKPTNVRRCSWFYKGTTDSRYVPYTEGVAEKLEEEYRHGITTGEWHRRLVLPNNEVVIMHGPSVMVHFWQGPTDAFSTPAITLLGKRVYRNPPKIRVAKDQSHKIDHLVFLVHGAGESKGKEDTTSRPRVVRRGHEESEIEEANPTRMDHLLLLCHGVGSACDMRFRSVEEVVEDFRATSLQLVQSHYKNSYENGIVNRVEVLPISWHAQLHGGEAGVDSRLQRITLDSIPRLRAFTNHTVLDVLFYTSPVYHQTIIDTVCFELNRIYNLFKQRNPNFIGGISLGGHSLGSVILYDLLCNQVPNPTSGTKPSAEKTYLPDITSSKPIKYPKLEFQPDALYALGSPIAIFECIRGVETLGLGFHLPTCQKFFNIFHPYDPIAYRIEPLINSELKDIKPFLIPHHKGRKRMHLELKDTMVRVGTDLKQKLLESLRTTWNKWKAAPPIDGQLEKVVEEEMEKEQLCEDSKEENQDNIEMCNPEVLGHLNAGRRVDYVLQEAPLEMINEYLFAMSSHVGYWESEDTMLLMLREIYSSLGVQPDSTVPQQSMTVQRTRKLDEAMVVDEKGNPSS